MAAWPRELQHDLDRAHCSTKMQNSVPHYPSTHKTPFQCPARKSKQEIITNVGVIPELNGRRTRSKTTKKEREEREMVGENPVFITTLVNREDIVA